MKKINETNEKQIDVMTVGAEGEQLSDAELSQVQGGSAATVVAGGLRSDYNGLLIRSISNLRYDIAVG